MLRVFSFALWGQLPNCLIISSEKNPVGIVTGVAFSLLFPLERMDPFAVLCVICEFLKPLAPFSSPVPSHRSFIIFPKEDLVFVVVIYITRFLVFLFILLFLSFISLF